MIIEIEVSDKEAFMIRWAETTARMQLRPRTGKRPKEAGARRILMYYLWLNGMSKTKLSILFGYNQPSTVVRLLNEYESWFDSIHIESPELQRLFKTMDEHLNKTIC
jgi:hypothetical protein